MGKCVSKDQQLKIREIDERSYIAITDDFEYYQYDDDDNDSEDYYYGGQTESKKKMPGRETKGTSISFGFNSKKNKNLAANKNNNNGEKEEQKKAATIISNHTVINEHNNFIIASDDNNNGNSETSTNEVNRTISPAKLQPAKRDQVTVGRSNRFGFRQNVVRPTSSIQPRVSEFADNVNNNNTKIRATSANFASTAYRTNMNMAKSEDKFDESEVTTVQKQQNEMNANTIVHPPSSQSIVLSRYTLHSTSLPRPQYAVAVSVTAPSYPSYTRGTTYTTLSSNSNRPTTSPTVQNKLIDSKGAKHQANLTKRGGMLTRRDESLDSGIHSHESTTSDHHQQPQKMQAVAMRRPQQNRSRRFEMVPIPGRHKFEIRDLSDFNDNDPVIPLSLPKLPTDRKEIVTNGLIRSTNSYNTDSEMDMSISGDSRPTSFISTASETESFEEEKLKLDSSYSEKSLKGAIPKQPTYKIPSSMSSSKLAFLGINESMAMNDCSSLSTSISIDENKRNKVVGKKDIDCDEDDLSSATITAGYSGYLNSSAYKISPSKDQKETVNDAFLKQQQQMMNPKFGSISRKELFIEVDEKFAETIEATKDNALLDDETSPSDSLVSSTDSGEALKKKAKDDNQNEEQDLEDITPELVEDLMSPGTPTHASNSLSLSDGGRDFLIDDEIADQPALMFSDKKHKGSPSHHDDYKTASEATPTLRDISAHGSIKSLNKLQSFKNIIKSGQSSPAVNRKSLERTGSLDTLSPCDSIASDDLMADFDLASSIDSMIERHEQSIDDLMLGSDVGDSKHAVFRSPQKNSVIRRGSSNRESITSLLPARATRLLNRRLQNNGSNNNSPLSHHGSESPRSLDSAQSRTSARASLREHLKQRQQLNLQSQLMNSSSNEDLLVDKSFRNAMLQDVVSFKKQLVQLRRVLQEDEDKLMRSDTLNPFEMNGQIFSNLNNNSNNNNNNNGSACENEKEMMPTGGNCVDKEKRDNEKNVVLTNEQLIQLEDQRQELADLRRHVVFLQSQIDDRDRTIKVQQTKLEQLEKEKVQLQETKPTAKQPTETLEKANCATQTERLRPMSMGQDFTSPLRETSHKPSNIPSSEATKPQPTITVKPSPPRSKTQISSVYAKLSSIKPTTSATSLSAANNHKNSSIPTTNYSTKPMKSTKIEHPHSPMHMKSAANVNRANEPAKSPLRRTTIPQLKPIINGSAKLSQQKLSAPSKKSHADADSNGNSATSSLSTSSSNSSLNAASSSGSRNIVVPSLANQLNEIYNRGLIE